MKVIFTILLTINFTSCLKSETKTDAQSNFSRGEKPSSNQVIFPSVVDLRNQIVVDTSNVEYGRLKLVDNQSKKTLFQGNVQLLKKDNFIPVQGSVPSEIVVTLEKDNKKQVKIVRLDGNNLKI